MKKNKMILAFAIGAIALNVATVSMSIAWYANSVIAYVDAIDITFDGDKDLFMATEIDGDYKQELDYSELTPTTIFKPVTTAYRNKWMNNKSDKPVFYDDAKSTTATSQFVAHDGYYSQEIYLKTNDDIYVTVNPEKTFIKANEKYNKSYAKELYDQFQLGDNQFLKALSEEQVENRLNQLVKAMRFSILVPDENEYYYEVIDPYKEEETLLGGILDNDIDQYYDHHISLTTGEDVETVYGEIVGDKENIIYGDVLTSDSLLKDGNEEPNAFNAKHKEGVRPFLGGVEFKKEEATLLSDYEKNVKPFHFTLNAYEPKKIVVSVYIEGWDLDSVNYTMGATFDASLSLKIERER